MSTPWHIGATGDGVAGFGCEPPPLSPPRDLVFGYRYKRSDFKRAEIDPQALAAYRQQTKGLRQFENRLAEMTNAYLKSGKQNRAVARCALGWLSEWAKAGAYLGTANGQGIFVRQWGLAVAGSAYAQVRDAPVDSAQKQAIENWLKDVADKVAAGFADNDARSMSLRNNHLYWAAWAVTITGVALNDRGLYRWGVNKARFAILNQIKPDGTLPLEMARGEKALQYHMFALTPLILIAETALANGENLYDLNNGLLRASVRQVFAGLEDPSLFSRKAGVPQDSPDDTSSANFAWLEIYNKRFPDAGMEAWLTNRRPIFSRRAGGDVRFLF